jgi:hypothetical protein
MSQPIGPNERPKVKTKVKIAPTPSQAWVGCEDQSSEYFPVVSQKYRQADYLSAMTLSRREMSSRLTDHPGYNDMRQGHPDRTDEQPRLPPESLDIDQGDHDGYELNDVHDPRQREPAFIVQS